MTGSPQSTWKSPKCSSLFAKPSICTRWRARNPSSCFLCDEERSMTLGEWFTRQSVSMLCQVFLCWCLGLCWGCLGSSLCVYCFTCFLYWFTYWLAYHLSPYRNYHHPVFRIAALLLAFYWVIQFCTYWHSWLPLSGFRLTWKTYLLMTWNSPNVMFSNLIA